MPAPSPAAIVENPPPLSPTVFPYAVTPVPAQVLATLALALPVASATPGPQTPENPRRFEA